MDENFNPPAPRGTGPGSTFEHGLILNISIHPPLAGRDFPFFQSENVDGYFNPPAPRGTGLDRDPALLEHGLISIHPPLAGRD